VGLADLPGQRVGSAADQACVAGGVVGRAEGPLRQQPRGRHGPGHRVDAGGLQRLLEGHVRQYRGHAPGHQRLAAARRADHQHVVPARGGDLQRPFGLLLSLDVAKVLGELPPADQRLVGHGL